MSLTAAELAFLADAGLTLAQVVEFAALRPESYSIDTQAERRRAADRERKRTAKSAEIPQNSAELVSSPSSSSSPPIPPLITTPSPSSNNTGLDAGATDWPANAEVIETIIAETGLRLTNAETWHLRTAGVVALWRHNGFSFWDEVLPTIKALIDGGAKVKSWAYFTDAIAECRANRLKPIPIPEPRQPHERRNPDNRDQSAGRSTDYMREAIDLDQQRRGAKLDRASGF